MRELIKSSFGVGDADELKQLDGAGARLLLVHVKVDGQRFGDLQPDGEQRIERRHRLLEDHRNVAPADFAHLVLVEVEQIATIEYDAAVWDAAGVSRQQAHDRECRDRFARPQFTDDGDGFATPHTETQPLDRPHHPARGEKMDMQILYLKQRARVLGLQFGSERLPHPGLDQV